MTRMSKPSERRNQSPRRRRGPSVKTGSLKDQLPLGYRPHDNAVDGELAKVAFIPKIR